jgi:hypothetical protein
MENMEELSKLSYKEKALIILVLTIMFGAFMWVTVGAIGLLSIGVNYVFG